MKEKDWKTLLLYIYPISSVPCKYVSVLRWTSIIFSPVPDIFKNIHWFISVPYLFRTNWDNYHVFPQAPPTSVIHLQIFFWVLFRALLLYFYCSSPQTKHNDLLSHLLCIINDPGQRKDLQINKNTIVKQSSVYVKKAKNGSENHTKIRAGGWGFYAEYEGIYHFYLSIIQNTL